MMMNRSQRRKIMRLMGAKKEKVAEVKSVWDKYFPNGDRQLSDEEFKRAQEFAVEDYKDWFDDKEERQDFRKDCQAALTKYLKGECDYSHLCNETQCYDDDEIGFPIVYAFPLASYLQKKGII